MLINQMNSRLILTLVLLFISYSDSANAATLGNETDRLSLLAFKSQITDDPLQVLSSWNDSINFCEWQGVTCSRRHYRVTSLNLHGKDLLGSVSTHIGNLSFLKLIDLRQNRLQGAIPEDISRLFRLQYLHLANNTLEGRIPFRIPFNLSHCSELMILDLSRNNLIGNLPPELGSLSKLVVLDFSNNNLIGGIPSSFGNLSSLQKIIAQYNNLEGSIPETVGQMLSLTSFRLAANRFSGRFPLSLFNVSSINTISVSDNHLDGSLPPDIGFTLRNLKQFGIAANNFAGPIPLSFSNASKLEVFDISSNYFAGEVPSNLGQPNLQWFNIGQNRFGTGKKGDLTFLTSLTNCTGLEKLGLFMNDFGGVLPNSFSNLSTKLNLLDLSVNQISGSIPARIGNLVGLNTLVMNKNLFSGSIPVSFGELPNLQRLYLGGNKLTGKIPPSLGNISQLSDLYLANNSFEGSIPASLGNCPNLQQLDFSMNNLNGSIPEQVLGLFNQPVYVDLSRNSLRGHLSAQVGRLRNLEHFDVSNNALSGEIPSSLGSCSRLERLYLAGNFFQGEIPASLANLNGLRELNLSNNNFSGKIPMYLGSLPSLERLNLSFNDFEGRVPIKGVFRNVSAVSLVGNKKLCGGIIKLQLHTCPQKESVKHKKSPNLKFIFTLIAVVIFLALVSCSVLYYWKRKPMKEPSSTPVTGDQHVMVSYKELLQATNGFSSGNLIGSGSFGHVYKGTLSQNELIATVAVKVFHRHQKGVSKSFLAECEALRNIRHRNLVKILTSCSSMDYEGNDFKALVFEFMPNGSLERWLHTDADGEESHSMKLGVIQMLNVAVDVASALHYLHHQCHVQIVHCDLKPSNILLDDEMIAHLGDFGLARLLSETTNNFSMNETSSIGLKGSIGYAAPEYGMGGKPSTQGDVYSYGILLLEMFIGKKPTDGMFKDGLNLHNFARTALQERVPEIVDPVHADEEIQPEENIGNIEHSNSNEEHFQECQVAMIRIGLECSVEPPGERMSMDDVTREVSLIRHKLLATMDRGQL